MRTRGWLLIVGFASSACAVGVDAGDYGSIDGSTGGHEASVDAGPSTPDAGKGDDAPGLADAAPGADASVAADGSPHEAGDASGVEGGGTPADAGGADAGGGLDAGGTTDAGGGTDSGGTACSAHGFSGTLAAWDLSAQAGSEASAPATSSASGVTAGALSRSAALTAVSGSGSINSSGWPTASSADATRYYTFAVTPAAGCTVSLSSLAIAVRASATGPTAGDVATSADSFSAHVGSLPGTASTTVSFANASSTGAIEVRIYGYGASSSAGTFRVESTLTLSGSLN